MKILITTLTAVTTFATPAYANLEILPNLYADKYCMFRRNGVARDEAIKTAIHEASIYGNPQKVLIKGQQIGVDVLAAVEAVERMCPELMQP